MPKRKSKPSLSYRKSSKRHSNRLIPLKDAIYEQMKAALPHDLTPKQYEAAIQRIARELGI